MGTRGGWLLSPGCLQLVSVSSNLEARCEVSINVSMTAPI